MKDSFEVLLEECQKRNAALISSDICLQCCDSREKDLVIPVIVNVSLKIEDEVFPAACIMLCVDCKDKQDYNQLIKNLRRFSMEGRTFKL